MPLDLLKLRRKKKKKKKKQKQRNKKAANPKFRSAVGLTNSKFTLETELPF